MFRVGETRQKTCVHTDTAVLLTNCLEIMYRDLLSVTTVNLLQLLQLLQYEYRTITLRYTSVMPLAVLVVTDVYLQYTDAVSCTCTDLEALILELRLTVDTAVTPQCVYWSQLCLCGVTGYLYYLQLPSLPAVTFTTCSNFQLLLTSYLYNLCLLVVPWYLKHCVVMQCEM